MSDEILSGAPHSHELCEACLETVDGAIALRAALTEQTERAEIAEREADFMRGALAAEEDLRGQVEWDLARLREALAVAHSALHAVRTDRPTAHTDRVWEQVNDAAHVVNRALLSPDTKEGNDG